MKGRFLLRLARRGDAGFTLVETLVALVIATIVFTSLAYVAVGALRASLLSRTNQQAIDFGDQRLEEVRDLPYASVAMVSSDLSGDPNVLSCSGQPCVRLGDGSVENIYTATGGISPHVTTQQGTQSNQVAYTLRTYVTNPTDSFGATYRRVSVQVTWNSGSSQLTRWVSSIVSYTQRGLPLPVFNLTPVGSTSVTVAANGAYATYLFDITNQGAADHWNLTMSGGRTWQFWADNGDGVFDPTTDTQLTDTTADGIVDTGYLSPTQSLHFWVTSQVATGTTPATVTQTLTATSVAQPTAASGTASASTTLTIVDPGSTASPSSTPSPTSTGTAALTTCPAASVPAAVASNSYTLVSYTLHNRSGANPSWPPSPYPPTDPVTGTSTVTQGLPLVMATDANTVPSGRLLPVYSTDVDPAVVGRVLNTGGSLASTNTTNVVDWRSTNASKSYSGTAVLSFWAGSDPTSPSTAISLQAQLYAYTYNTTAKTYSEVGLGSPITMTANPFVCAGVQQFTAQFTGLSVKLGNGEFIGVRVWDNGTAPVRLAYDGYDYPSSLTLPEK